LFEIRKPESLDIISYSVLRSKYGDTVQVAIVLDSLDDESLYILTIPRKEIRKIKWSPKLPNLKIITQAEIKEAVSSVSK